VDFLLILAVLAVVVAVVAWPVYHGLRPGRRELPADVPALEAARDAKFREIRDTELDFRTGKLDEADFRALDAQLRAEALEIIEALDAATPRGPETPPRPR
jgi:hypothetical protein